jgi:acetyl esterase/lipase
MRKNNTSVKWASITSTAIALFLVPAFAVSQDAQPVPLPTYADMQYGPHERHVLDFWHAGTASPSPLAVYFYGGGFRRGSKDLSDTQFRENGFHELLDAGISVASVDYRLLQHASYPAAFEDAADALQFLRSKAEELGVDKNRVAAFGTSSGAQLAMWLAFHDETGDADAVNPVNRESTRVLAVGNIRGQTTMVEDLWLQWLPTIEAPEQNQGPGNGGSDDPEERRRIFEYMSAVSNISADDPPIFMTYRSAPDDPVPSSRAGGWRTHHVNFGVKLKERADEVGVEAHLTYPGTESNYASVQDFLGAKLLGN